MHRILRPTVALLLRGGLPAVLLTALLIRLLFVLVTDDAQRWFTDSNHYYLLGVNWLKYGQFTMFVEAGFPESIRLPGYPLFLALFGETLAYPVVILLQCVASAATIAVLFHLGVRTGIARQWALAASWFMAWMPLDIMLAGTYLSETLFNLTFYGGLLCILSLRKGWTITGGVLFGVAALTRGQGLWLVIPAMMMAYHTVGRKSWLAAAPFVLLVFLWMIRNEQMFNRWFVTDAATVVALHYSVPATLAKAEGNEAEKHFQTYRGWSEGTDWSNPQEVNQYMAKARSEIRRVIGQHPVSFAQVWAKNAAGILLAPGRGMTTHYFSLTAIQWVVLGISAAMAMLLLAGTFGAFATSLFQPKMTTLMWLMMVAIVIGSASFSTIDARFRSPAVVAMLLASAWFFQKAASRWSVKQRPL
ncbi:MAG: hypothetical protein EA392_13870 [Cryomorphaceae bacterium]|nr:MAG: hypothetical protein EA392_13870 [Cryomorphaceae bacterium]